MVYEYFFIFAGLWAIGGPVGGGQDDEKDFKDFSGLWKGMAKLKFPEQNLAYDYYFDINEMKWAHWNNRIQPYV
jgi:dynein heavy chain